MGAPPPLEVDPLWKTIDILPYKILPVHSPCESSGLLGLCWVVNMLLVFRNRQKNKVEGTNRHCIMLRNIAIHCHQGPGLLILVQILHAVSCVGLTDTNSHTFQQSKSSLSRGMDDAKSWQKFQNFVNILHILYSDRLYGTWIDWFW